MELTVFPPVLKCASISKNVWRNKDCLVVELASEARKRL